MLLPTRHIYKLRDRPAECNSRWHVWRQQQRQAKRRVGTEMNYERRDSRNDILKARDGHCCEWQHTLHHVNSRPSMWLQCELHFLVSVDLSHSPACFPRAGSSPLRQQHSSRNDGRVHRAISHHRDARLHPLRKPRRPVVYILYPQSLHQRHRRDVKRYVTMSSPYRLYPV